ncbi:MAG: hypothetical protein HDR57_02830 [Treponema sp.]|nr:hypothetical protein [Treponema sp.]
MFYENFISSSDKLLRPNSQLYLNHHDLLHNMGSWQRKYAVEYKEEQQNNQEQSNGL